MFILQIISGFLLIYILILFIRILLSWVRTPGVHDSAAYSFLYRITEPYLSIFRKIKFLHIGHFDISPVFAILILQLISFILSFLAAYGTITIGIIAFAALRGIMNIVMFILGFILVLFIIKIVVMLAKLNTASRAVIVIDNILHPIMGWINIRFFKRRIVQYKTSMWICTLIFAVLLTGSVFLTMKVLPYLLRL